MSIGVVIPRKESFGQSRLTGASFAVDRDRVNSVANDRRSVSETERSGLYSKPTTRCRGVDAFTSIIFREALEGPAILEAEVVGESGRRIHLFAFLGLLGCVVFVVFAFFTKCLGFPPFQYWLILMNLMQAQSAKESPRVIILAASGAAFPGCMRFFLSSIWLSCY